MRSASAASVARWRMARTALLSGKPSLASIARRVDAFQLGCTGVSDFVLVVIGRPIGGYDRIRTVDGALFYSRESLALAS